MKIDSSFFSIRKKNKRVPRINFDPPPTKQQIVNSFLETCDGFVGKS